MLCGNTWTSSALTEPEAGKSGLTNESQMDALDIMSVAYRFMAATPIGDGESQSLWDQTTAVKDFHPLYNEENQVIAYYVSFEPSGYVIVNNNRQNPIALEFSDEDSLYKETMVSKSAGEPVFYGLNLDNDQVGVSLKSVEENDPLQFLSVQNQAEMTAHENIKSQVLSSLRDRSNIQSSMQNDMQENNTISLSALRGSYDNIITDGSSLPSGSFSANNLPYYNSVTWGIMNDFSSIAGGNNHCGATAAFNVINYYSVRYGRSALMNGSRANTFSSIFSKVGNGPVLFSKINSGLQSYVNERGYSYSGGSCGYYSSIKSRVQSGQMCMILTSASIINMHYINAIGYRDYTTGSSYIRVINEWDNSINKYLYSTLVLSSYYTHIL